MGLFKRWRAKRAAKKQLKAQSKAQKEEKVVLKEENVEETRNQQNKQKATATPTKVEKTTPKDEKSETKEEVTEAPKETRETKPRYHVSQNKDKKNPNYKRWGVRLSSSNKTIKFHDTQAEAIKQAEQLAKNNDTTFVIHKLDGKIRKQNY